MVFRIVYGGYVPAELAQDMWLPQWLISGCTLKVILFHLFGPRTGLEKILWMHAQIEDNFWRNLHVESWVDWHHVSNYFSDILVPFIVWHPMKLHGWPTPFSGPVCHTFVCLHVLHTTWCFQTYLTACLYI
jgi:hypothetical protein